MKNIKKWKSLKTQLVVNNKWYKLRKDAVKLPNGKVLSDYYYLDGNEVAVVVAVTPENKILWERQYKYGARDIVWELPAGFVDEDETPREAAKRELLEETGYTAKKFIFLRSVWNSPTKSNVKVHWFLALGASKLHEAEYDKIDGTEDIETVALSIAKSVKSIEKNEHVGSDSVGAFFLALEKMKKLGLLP